MISRHNFKNLKVWTKGMDLVDKVYDFAETLPDNEKYGLRSQSTRSAVSIPSNIAEGSGKTSNKDFARFCEIALASSFELETQLLICQRRNFGDAASRNEALALVNEEQRMIMSFHASLKRKIGFGMFTLAVGISGFLLGLFF